MSKPLDEYREKRSFSKTPEPRGRKRTKSGDRFVVQEHDASSLHWDFRLEIDGVLKSWAVPKGVPTEPRIRRLAVATEDHPIEYAEFEGEIPDGEYGAGTVKIWDSGRFALLKREEDKIEVVLEGERLFGKYVLVRLKNDLKNWLMFRVS